MESEAAELSAVVCEIYDAAVDPILWKQALGSICAFVGGLSAALYWHDAATERSEALYLFNEDPVYTRLYFEKYLPMNPMFPAATFIDAGVVATAEEIMPTSEFVRTRFYKEWLAPQGIVSALSVNLEKGVTRASMISIRTGGPIEHRMHRRLGLLVPHLQRAVAIGRLFKQSRTTTQALTETLDHVEAAVFLVDAKAGLAFANETAKKMLGEATLVRKEGNALRAVTSNVDRMLRNLFVAAEEGDLSVGARGIAEPLKDASNEAWFAHVLPMTSGKRRQIGNRYVAVAAVFLRKTAPNALSPLEGIAKLYKLTAGEVRVLDALLKVNGVSAIAKSLGVSQSTVKTHLHNVFGKTGTKRQSELVKLVAGI
ncbi:MAG: helix-turn-helix transcriptional regulator [Vulcanimicrobiaceae bacterium]